MCSPTCDEILLAISLQSHSAHCRGGSGVDGINILAGTFEHLTVQIQKTIFSFILELKEQYVAIVHAK